VSGWDQLLSIEQDARDELEQQRAEPPIACPNDGTVLVADPAGGLRCSFDGWHYPTDARL
jgi:hypothetical protein|tara:strand:+ start:98 stop:277 length:180 start_codon:yes stop_codon:yes gene_type:complete